MTVNLNKSGLADCGPYNYSDMTGAVALGATSPSGIWSVTLDGGVAGRGWRRADFTIERPAGTEVVVELRAADNKATLGTLPLRRALSGAAFCDMTGRFLEVRARLVRGTTSESCVPSTATESPVLHDLTVYAAPVPLGPPDGLTLTIATDKTSYGPNETVQITSVLTNLFANGRSGTARIDILDETGQPVATPLQNTTVLFTGAGADTYTPTFFTSLLPPGPYFAEVTYLEGDTVRRVRAAFDILPDLNLVAGITTDRVLYGANEDVLITSTVENTGLNAAFYELVLVVQIPGAPSPLFTQTFAPFDLGASSSQDRIAVWNTGLTLPGNYVATLAVRENGEIIGSDQTAFTIEASSGRGFALTGTLDAVPSVVSEGESVTLPSTLTNTGNVDLTQLATLFRVLDPATLEYQREQSGTLSLAKGQTAAPQVTFDTVAMGLGPRVGTLEVSTAGETLLTLFAPFTVIDTTPPVVSISAPACTNQDVHAADHRGRAAPGHGGSLPERSSVQRADDHEPRRAPLRGGRYRYQRQSRRCRRRTSSSTARRRQSRSPAFRTIRSPERAITPIVAFADPDGHLTASVLVVNGMPFTSGTTITAEGTYTLTATATDCAGNTTLASVSFEIDLQAPVVSIDVPACTQSNVAPVITAVDPNLQSVVSLLDGAPYAGAPITTEGEHLLEVTALDTTGNQGFAQATFVIDRTSPDISIAGVSAGLVTAQSVTPIVEISDAHLVHSALTLDGETFVSGSTLVADGTYALAASASDCAGNSTERSLTFTIDKTAPAISIEVPECVNTDVTPIVTVVEMHPSSEQRFLDGALFAGTTISAEGEHQFRVEVVDTAGNEAERSASFTIDRTLPTIAISGVTDGEIAPDSVAVTVVFNDANLTTTSITLDGQPFTSGSLVTPEGTHTLVASANDCAGNSAQQTIHFEIRRVAGDLTQTLSLGPLGQPRVMLGLDCVGGAGPNCTIGNPNLLRSTLNNASIAFEEAVGRDAWRRALRSGRFNVYILYLPHESETKLFQELNEAVWLCEGLLVTKVPPDAMPNLREALGLEYGGATVGPVTITLSVPLGTGSVTAVNASWLQLGAGQPVASAQIGPNVRMLAGKNAPGLGTALSLGWDGETSGSSVLYRNAVTAVTPGGVCTLLPGGAADVRVTVTNTGVRATTYSVEQTLAAGLTTTDPLQHSLSVSPGQTSEFNLALRLPSTLGSYQVGGTLSAEGQQLDTDELVITVEHSATTLAVSATAALQTLVLSGANAIRRDDALALIQSAAARTNPEDAITDVLKAIDKVRQITSADVTPARIDLARLLRVYQLRWIP